MRRFIIWTMWVIIGLVLAPMAQAELLLVENFETLTVGNIDDQNCSGELGGFWDTQSNTTGNAQVEDEDGSQVLQYRSLNAGGGRGAAFAGITNPIDNTETGVCFFRFKVRTDSNGPRSFMGLHALTGNDPLSTTNPAAVFVAGFGALDDGAGGYNITALDGTTILKTGMVRGSQWYNCWIMADNASDVYDLYISEAAGPGGELELPDPEDMILSGHDFDMATEEPITGGAFVCTDDTVASARAFVDDIYWDGDSGLKSRWAINPTPDVKATGVPLNQILSWEAPNDPAIGQIISYTIYVDPNQTKVIEGSDVTWEGENLTETSYDPMPDFALDTTYYWRVETKLIMANDPNQIQLTIPGKLWSFTARLSTPVFEQQPTNLLVDPGDTAEFTVVVSSIRPVSYTWYKTLDKATDTPGDDTMVGNSATLTISDAQVAQEGYYFCKADNGEPEYSEVTWLGVRRLVAHWTLDSDKIADGAFVDETGDHPAAITDPADPVEFVTGIIDDAVDFDPNSNAIVGEWNPSEFSNQISISVWINWDGSELDDVGIPIIEKINAWGSDTMMWTLRIRAIADGKAGIRFYNASDMSVWPRGVITPGEWTHVCATFGDQSASVYINGILVETDDTSELSTALESELGFPTGTFPGLIDDIQVYNYSLGLTDVIDIYNDVTGENFCILESFDNRYDLSGPQGEPDCKIDIYDFADLTAHWLDCGLYPNCQ